ncbi:transposase [Roseovarius autotrophicus]|uniref:transposase n=1 Tax=Roseovarius autotrophicus TaxID=2824121 RepID=UPI003AB92395
MDPFLGAGHYERTPERRGYANGTKPKRIDTPAGTVNVQVPKTAGHDGEPCLTAIAGARPAISARRHAGGRRDVHQGRVDP